jgi:mono/diheme cytochrome c family protein
MSKLAFASLGFLLIATAGCRGTTSKDTPVFGIRNMYDQPKYNVQSESDFFADHRTMRPLVEGVVAHDQEVDPVIAQGRLEDQSGYVLEIPPEVITRGGGMAALEERGRARFNIYCAPCHDMTGHGNGAIRRHALATGATAFAPPTFHQDRIRHMPDGQLFATISNGKNNMPPYAMQIPIEDRWAIVSYVRVLQLADPKMAGAEETPAEPKGKTGDAKPAESGSAAPAMSGSAAPAMSGSAAPAMSAKAPAPATSAKAPAPAGGANKDGGTP